MQLFVNEITTAGFRVSHVAQEKPRDMKTAHIHREYEILYLIEGERYYFIEDKAYLIMPKSLVMVRSGDVHRTTNVRPNIPYERFLLILSDEYIRPLLSILNVPSVSSFFSVPVLPLPPTMQTAVRSIFETIFSELSAKSVNHEGIIQLKIAELLLLTSRCHTLSANVSDVIIPSSGKYKKVNEAIFYIKEHFREALSLGEIADHIYVSRGHLSNIFNEVTGMKVTDYINVRRINYAKNLLAANTGLSITELADLCGFESITYFERVFKQVAGTSPSYFRKSLQSGGK